MMLLLLLCFFSLARTQDSKCVKQLQALFKPEFCGIKYFEKLSCELNSELISAPVKNDAEMAKFCLQFSSETQVDLSILDAQGIDLCTLNNPTAASFILVGSSLLHRSAEDRYSIYLNYAREDYVQPPPGDPNMDIIGLMHVYQNITLPDIQKRTQNIIPYAVEVLEYIESYPDSGLQVVSDIQNQVLFATLVASVPASEASQYFINVWTAYQHSPYRTGNPFYFSYQTGQFLLSILSWTGILNGGLQSYSNRAANYNSVNNLMFFYQEALGILKSFAQLLPVNTFQNDVCSYAYNLELPYGIIRRVIFSQNQILSCK